MTVEEFAERLREELEKQFSRWSNDETVRVRGLSNAIGRALQPKEANTEFPQMLYLGGSRNDFLLVGSVEERLKAKQLGYITTPNPQYASDFPQSWVETPASGRGSDLRRVLLRDADEQKRFDELTRKAHWRRDDALEFGGRGTNLHELILEKEAELQQVMHDELHGTGVAPHAEGADADQGGDTTTSVAPDSAVLKSAGE